MKAVQYHRLSDHSQSECASDSSNLAVSYARFSDPQQGAGDSEDRQAREFAAFCERHKLTPAKQQFVDRGLSGFHDKHRKKGDLGRLIELAKSDTFPKGTVIVVEAWDRLGRLRPDKQTELVAELVRTGVHIGICRLNDIFTEEDFGTHKWIILQVFTQLAYDESKQKSERVAASWKKRKERARESGKLTTTTIPAWLEVVDGEAVIIPERANAVQRIFTLAAEGFGIFKIVQRLAEEGVPAFGERTAPKGKNSKRSRFSGKWNRSYVTKILNDKRVLGEYQPTLMAPSRHPDGEPIKDYFPAVVTEELFYLARAAARARHNQPVAKPSRQRKMRNLFGGLLVNAVDGEGFVVHNRSTRGKPELLLLNASGIEARADCVTFNYDTFQKGLMCLLREVKASEVFPAQSGDRVEELRKKLTALNAQVEELTDDLRRAPSRSVSTVLREKEAEEERVKEELERAKAEAAHPAAHDWESVGGLAAKLEDEESRVKLRAVLQRRIQRIDVLIANEGRVRVAVAQVTFAGSDLRRNFVLCHRARAAGRAGGALCWSYKDIAGWVDKQRDLGQYRSDERVRAGYDRYVSELLPDVVAAMKGDDKAKRKLADSEGRQNVVSWTIE
ncbi:MAG TPA: recombinase family protein [Gemmataceae bacterium]|jgi:DNA invertase Pin-like site-specific DNA recombinase